MSDCDHTLHALDDQGQTTGSWVIEANGKSSRVVCRFCRKFYVKVEVRKQDEEQERLRQAYLEQQRRLSCPGCGEEPFLG